jgi:hypothetical protein
MASFPRRRAPAPQARLATQDDQSHESNSVKVSLIPIPRAETILSVRISIAATRKAVEY